ncbi:hypothetical protein Xkhy_20765 [Xanthomonas axonopodis pv. khayae]|uniref:AbiU2 domain-containing protein n=1 Tax=Xanthomonas axonopodis TaxID=53413 RepID=UPI000996E79D|nr:hypothetical protein [Xanthomonas axonopodis]OOX06159.1 hypothetical protein Xkhy_20765 [Xanthomonas axonopodis pv. khayae]
MDAQLGSVHELSEATREEGRQRERDRNMLVFDEEWARLSVAMEELFNDLVGISFKTFRDKRHAHWEMQPIDQEPAPFDIDTLNLTYDGVFELGLKCEKILAELGKLLTHTHWEPSEFSEMSAEQGSALWMTLAN